MLIGPVINYNHCLSFRCFQDGKTGQAAADAKQLFRVAKALGNIMHYTIVVLIHMRLNLEWSFRREACLKAVVLVITLKKKSVVLQIIS